MHKCNNDYINFIHDVSILYRPKSEMREPFIGYVRVNLANSGSHINTTPLKCGRVHLNISDRWLSHIILNHL